VVAVAILKSAFLTGKSRNVLLSFYCCLLKITVKTIIKATAKIEIAITALKSMYIIIVK